MIAEEFVLKCKKHDILLTKILTNGKRNSSVFVCAECNKIVKNGGNFDDTHKK